MAKPRRAVPRRISGRALVSAGLIGLTAIATFAVWQMSDTEASVALPAAAESDHWSQHVQAQTDANAGRISLEGMKKSFMRTRLLGPSDIASYRGALDLAAAQSGSCATPKGAPAATAAVLSKCSSRFAAQ